MTLFTKNINEIILENMTDKKDSKTIYHSHSSTDGSIDNTDDSHSSTNGTTDDSIDNIINTDHSKNKNSFINSSLDTLDRKLIIIDNYAIINKHHIFILKLFTIILVIMLGIYVGIHFKKIPKIIGMIALTILSIVFYFILIIVIVKNSLIYRINRNDIYYPKDNPLDLRKKFFTKKCAKPDHINNSNTSLEKLIDILTNLKNTAVTYKLYDEAYKYYSELVYIIDNITENEQYGPFANDVEINKKIDFYSKDDEVLEKKIKTNMNNRITILRKQSKKIKQNMLRYSELVINQEENKEKKKAQYLLQEKKYNSIMKSIRDLKKKSYVSSSNSNSKNK
tara:strand:+ start:1500 stop:2510 length:1011 start_codon:yes stop_codon:yes gene_type:complete